MSSYKFVNPRNDIAFKKIFGNEHKTEILISFLNAVLDLTGDREIQEVEILNPYQAPRIATLKHTLLDVRATDKRGVTFIREMQVENMVGLKVYFIKHAGDLTVIPANADTEPLQAAYEMANRFNWTREELEVYEYWDIKAQDARGMVQAARQEGRQEGEQRKATETARKMLAKGYDLAEIAELTGLSADDLATLDK